MFRTRNYVFTSMFIFKYTILQKFLATSGHLLMQDEITLHTFLFIPSYPYECIKYDLAMMGLSVTTYPSSERVNESDFDSIFGTFLFLPFILCVVFPPSSASMLCSTTTPPLLINQRQCHPATERPTGTLQLKNLHEFYFRFVLPLGICLHFLRGRPSRPDRREAKSA